MSKEVSILTAIDDFKVRAITAAAECNRHYNEGRDLLRNHTNYGRANAFVLVLGELGCDIKMGTMVSTDGNDSMPTTYTSAPVLIKVTYLIIDGQNRAIGHD